MGKKQTSQIPNILLSVKDASVAISVSTKMVRLLIASGRLKAVNLGKRMTRIGAPDKPCGVGRADANPKLLLNDT